jgi:hypothetical protein
MKFHFLIIILKTYLKKRNERETEKEKERRKKDRKKKKIKKWESYCEKVGKVGSEKAGNEKVGTRA